MSKRERATGRGKAWLVPSLLLALLVHDYLFYYYKSTNTVSLGTKIHHTCADSCAYAPLPHSRAYAPIVMRMRMLP